MIGYYVDRGAPSIYFVNGNRGHKDVGSPRSETVTFSREAGSKGQQIGRYDQHVNGDCLVLQESKDPLVAIVLSKIGDDDVRADAKLLQIVPVNQPGFRFGGISVQNKDGGVVVVVFFSKTSSYFSSFSDRFHVVHIDHHNRGVGRLEWDERYRLVHRYLLPTEGHLLGELRVSAAELGQLVFTGDEVSSLA